LSLIEAITQILIALTIVCKADTCDTHTLSSDLVVPGTSKVAIVCVPLTASCKDKTVVLNLVRSIILVFGFFHGIFYLVRCNVLAEATILLMFKRKILTRRVPLLEHLFQLSFHHLHLDVHPLHLAVVVLAQTLDL